MGFLQEHMSMTQKGKRCGSSTVRLWATSLDQYIHFFWIIQSKIETDTKMKISVLQKSK